MPKIMAFSPKAKVSGIWILGTLEVQAKEDPTGGQLLRAAAYRGEAPRECHARGLRRLEARCCLALLRHHVVASINLGVLSPSFLC